MEWEKNTYHVNWPIYPEGEISIEELRDYFASDNAKIAVSMDHEWAISVILQLIDRILKVNNAIKKYANPTRR